MPMQSHGHATQSLTSRWQCHPADIILLDIGLPGMSGYEVARTLRAAGSNVFLAALTGYGQESDRQRALDAGFNFHMTKPADHTKLETILFECSA